MIDFKKHELEIDGITHVYYPATKKKKYLVITFAAMSGIYNRVEQFYKEDMWDNTSYLFLADKQPYTWYVSGYENILKFYCDQFEKENIIMLGSSMGAFGAMWHGFSMPAAIVMAIAPASPSLSFNESNLLWEELQILMLKCKNLPILYMEATGFPPDHTMFRTISSHYINAGGKMVFETNPRNNQHIAMKMATADHFFSTAKYLIGWRSQESLVDDFTASSKDELMSL